MKAVKKNRTHLSVASVNQGNCCNLFDVFGLVGLTIVCQILHTEITAIPEIQNGCSNYTFYLYNFQEMFYSFNSR